MNIKLKICGMRDPDNITEVAALQPEYMGFIFYNQSPRYVGNDFAMPMIQPSIKKIGVFVNETRDEILNKINIHNLDFVQLHGNESVEYCRQLKAIGIKIIKAFAVDKDFDFESTRAYSKHVSYFLFDTKGKYFGGNATAFDWTLLQKYEQQTPFFISGGISSENVWAITELRKMNIHALDVNSGVEAAPGLKDEKKINELKRVLDSLSI